MVRYSPGSPQLWADIATLLKHMQARHPELARARALWQNRQGSEVVTELIDAGLEDDTNGVKVIEAISFYHGLDAARTNPVRERRNPNRRRNPHGALSAVDVAWIERHEHIIETFVAERNLRSYRPSQDERAVGRAFEKLAARQGMTVSDLLDTYLQTPRRGGEQSHWTKRNPGSSRRGRRGRNPMAVQHIDHAAYQERCTKMSEAQLRYTISDANAAMRAMPDGPKAGYYADEVNYCSNELAKRKRSSQRNPKADGSPTRGELRKVKFHDHLRAIREKGKAAEKELKRLTGYGRSTGEPVLKAEKTETQEAHPGHYAPALSEEAKFAQGQVENIDRLMAEIRDQMKDLTDDDEALADELSDKLIALGAQKKALKEAVTATNPRRRGPCFTGGRRSMHQYAGALRDLAAAVHRLGYALSGSQRRNHRRRR
jgi:hypothetical protein